MRLLLFAAIGLLAAVSIGRCDQPVFQPDSAGLQRDAMPLLHKFCLDCHGAQTQEADLRVDHHLTADMTDPANAQRWTEVVNVLNSHEMPPQDSAQPDPQEVAQLVDWVTAQLQRAESVRRSSDVVIRRLNRVEYENTIRDLIGIEFDAKGFPEDPAAGGFDNIGAAQSVSPLHIELYLKAAQEILEKALVSGDRPESIHWRFEPESGDSDANRVRYGDNNAIVNGGNNPLEGNGRVMRLKQWDRSIGARDFRVPNPGPYVVRIRLGGRIPTREDVVASAKHYLDERLQKQLQERPEREKWIRLEHERNLNHFRSSKIYDYGPPRIRVIVSQNGQPTVIGESDVTGSIADDAMQILEFPVTMSTANAGIELQYAYSIPAELENFWMQSGDAFARPEMLVDWFELEGPVHPQ